MKYLLLLLCFVSITFGQSIEDQVKKFDKPKDYAIRFDRFSKDTSVEYESVVKSRAGHASLSITLTFRNNGDREYWLFFSGAAGRPLYNHDKLRFLLDGTLFEIADETDIDYYASFALTSAEWSKLAAAKTVEMQLRGFEAKFDDKLLTAIRNLASLK